jgi:hypothetical protein
MISIFPIEFLHLIDVDWIGLAQDRGKRRAVVNAVMNIWVP